MVNKIKEKKLKKRYDNGIFELKYGIPKIWDAFNYNEEQVFDVYRDVANLMKKILRQLKHIDPEKYKNYNEHYIDELLNKKINK